MKLRVLAAVLFAWGAWVSGCGGGLDGGGLDGKGGPGSGGDAASEAPEGASGTANDTSSSDGATPGEGATGVAPRWVFRAGGPVISSPAVGPGGTVYVGSNDGSVYALDPGTGRVEWGYRTGAGVLSTPAVGADGTVFVGSADGKVYALDAGGAVAWAYQTGGAVRASPALASGVVYVVSDDGTLHALRAADGQALWSQRIAESVDANAWFFPSSPSVGPDGTVYVGSEDGSLYALNPDGSVEWSYATGGRVRSSPAVSLDGGVYVGSWDGFVYALSADGSLRWRYRTGSWVASSPALGPDGTLYVGSHDGYLYALNSADGSLRWRYRAGGAVGSSPAVAADGTVYVGSWKSVHAVNPDGTRKWRYELTEEVHVPSSPLVAPNGMVYVGAADGNVYAFSGEGQGPAQIAWPMWRRDPRRTAWQSPRQYMVERPEGTLVGDLELPGERLEIDELRPGSVTGGDPLGAYWAGGSGPGNPQDASQVAGSGPEGHPSPVGEGQTGGWAPEDVVPEEVAPEEQPALVGTWACQMFYLGYVGPTSLLEFDESGNVLLDGTPEATYEFVEGGQVVIADATGQESVYEVELLTEQDLTLSYWDGTMFWCDRSAGSTPADNPQGGAGSYDTALIAAVVSLEGLFCSESGRIMVFWAGGWEWWDGPGALLAWGEFWPDTIEGDVVIFADDLSQQDTDYRMFHIEEVSAAGTIQAIAFGETYSRALCGEGAYQVAPSLRGR